MTARRLITVLGLGLTVLAPVVAAQPKPTAKPGAKKAAPKPGNKRPLAPAKDAGSPADGTGGAAGAGAKAAPADTRGPAAGPSGGVPAGGEGTPVQMTEDPPPSDITGTTENPDAPRSLVEPESPTVVAVTAPARKLGYPVEEAARPITLPQNLSEVSIVPHAVVSPYASSTALRARYGITAKIQLGLTYVLGGIFNDPSTRESKQGFHPGKAVGLDVTVMLQDWVGVKVGVPVYISPLAVSLALGAPIKFMFGDKLALGGLDDLLNIRINRFAPTFYQELQNAFDNMTNTIKSQGELRVSLFGVYQYQPNLAIIARTGIQMEDFATGKTDGCVGECLTTFIHAGLNISPRKYLDLGVSIGFDDLAHGGSFAPAGFLAFRI
jgi:hypothetical protein